MHYPLMKASLLAGLLAVAQTINPLALRADQATEQLAIKAAANPNGAAMVEYLNATAKLTNPQEKLAALWAAALLADKRKDKEAILEQAGTISLPGARMLVSAFHHDDETGEAVTNATKALNTLMPQPKKGEDDPGAATDPYKTPAITEKWTDELGVLGRWQKDGFTLDLIAYPENTFLGALTDPEGKRQKLLGILKSRQLFLYGPTASGMAEKSEMLLKLQGKTDKPIVLERVTVGKTNTFPKPEKAITLFDGTDLDAFEKTSWKILSDGSLQSSPRTGNLKTKEDFGDVRLYLEFREALNTATVGQRRGNSGVILMGAYEVQLLDSFGLEAQPNDCGAIYSIAAPKVNASAPPLEWQSYLIEFHAPRFDAEGKKTANAKFSVWHNGTLIQENTEAPRLTGASPDKPSPRPEPSKPEALIIQDHGNTLQYRNMWIERL